MKTDKTTKDREIQIKDNGEGVIFGILRYVYVGSTISRGGDGSEKIRRRLAMAKNKLSKLKFLWNGQDP
ncbi:unnamed protein product, partial [Porites evermanni]